MNTPESSTANPLDLGQALGDAFGLLGRSLPLLLGLTAVVWLPFEGLSVGLQVLAQHLEPDKARDLWMGQMIAFGLALKLVEATLFIAWRARSQGSPLSLRTALQQGARRLGPMFEAGIRSGLFVMLGLLCLVIPGLILAVHYFLVGPVAALEGASGAAVLNRSADLTRGSRWKLLFLMLVTQATMFSAGAAVGMVTSIVPEGVAWLLETGLDLVTMLPCALCFAAYQQLATEVAGPVESVGFTPAEG